MSTSKETTNSAGGISRRNFVAATAAGAAALTAGLRSVAAVSNAAGSDEIRVGLIGCGGRGTGAAKDAVAAVEGKGIKIVAMGDLFADELEESKKSLQSVGEAFAVPDSACHVGFDAYKKVIHDPQVNYVILTTPPCFRPVQFRETVEAGKHCFFEKPVAVDPTGIRSIIESGKIAEQKNLKVVTGTIYRRDKNFVEGVNLIKEGKLGKPIAGYAYYMAGPGWTKAVSDDASEMERQCRNWLHYPWLAGDHIVEQSVHNIDVLHWIFGTPKSAFATGGKIWSTDPAYGPSYDHFSVEYEFEPDVRVQFTSRQMPNIDNRVANRIICEKGIADINPGVTNIVTHDGEVLLRSRRGENPYVLEHRDLIDAIRNDKPLNETQQIADSSLAAMIGRESAYSGKKVDFAWAQNESKQDLVPKELSFGDAPQRDVPVPGTYQLA